MPHRTENTSSQPAQAVGQNREVKGQTPATAEAHNDSAEVHDDPQELLTVLDEFITASLEAGISLNPKERAFLARAITQEMQIRSAQFQEATNKLTAPIPFPKEVLQALWRVTRTNFKGGEYSSYKDEVVELINALCDGHAFYLKRDKELVPAYFFAVEPGETTKGSKHSGFAGLRFADSQTEQGVALTSKNIHSLYINPQAVFPLMLLGRVLYCATKDLTIETEHTKRHYEFRFGSPYPQTVAFVKAFLEDPLGVVLRLQELQGGFKPNYDQETKQLLAVQPGIFRVKPSVFEEALIPIDPQPLVEKPKPESLSTKEHTQLSTTIQAVVTLLDTLPDSFLTFERGTPTLFLRVSVPRTTTQELSNYKKLIEETRQTIELALGGVVSASFLTQLVLQLEQIALEKGKTVVKEASTGYTHPVATEFATKTYLGGQRGRVLSISFRDAASIS